MSQHFAIVRKVSPFEYLDLGKWLGTRFQGPIDLAEEGEPLPDPTLALQRFLLDSAAAEVDVELFGDGRQSAQEWAVENDFQLTDVSREYMHKYGREFMNEEVTNNG